MLAAAGYCLTLGLMLLASWGITMIFPVPLRVYVFLPLLIVSMFATIGIVSTVDERRELSAASLKHGIFDGFALMKEWSVYMLSALVLGAAVFFFLSVAPNL